MNYLHSKDTDMEPVSISTPIIYSQLGAVSIQPAGRVGLDRIISNVMRVFWWEQSRTSRRTITERVVAAVRLSKASYFDRAVGVSGQSQGNGGPVT